MKKRTITGMLLALFVAPFVVFGTHFIALFILLVMGIGVYELLDIKRKANMDAIPVYIFVLSMIFSFLLIFDIPYISSYAFDYKNGILSTYGLNTLWVILFIITLLASSVFDKKYSIIDAVYTFTMVMFLSLGLKGMLYVRSFGGVSNINDGTLLLLYVLITTCATDIFAYFGGMTCYRLLGTSKVHKLNERISPKKTIEGTVVGTIFGTGLGFLFMMLVFKNHQLLSYGWYWYLILSLLISISGQIGDLILSAVKRYFQVKDYSSLLPGHGGVLDRIDSMLVNFMIVAIFMNLLTYII